MVFLAACEQSIQNNREVSQASVTSSNSNKANTEEFKDYWYKGQAEITSYKLSQARYGEIHEGNVVLVYVTEPFLPKKQVKADYPGKQNVPILKLNRTKKFWTGIYPYSVMSSIFSPVNMEQPALKSTFSSQEWCGQVFVQINNRAQWQVASRSYFESEGDQDFSLKKDLLEDDIWTKLRLNPQKLPLGKTQMIPGIEHLSLTHKPIKAYTVELSLKKAENQADLSVYRLHYPSLKRTVAITFQTKFPYTIESWTETQSNRYGSGELVTKAEKIKRIKSAYWSKNRKSDAYLHKELGL